jgi:hypothetical protein
MTRVTGGDTQQETKILQTRRAQIQMHSDVCMRRGHTRQEMKILHTHVARKCEYRHFSSRFGEQSRGLVSREEVTHTRRAYTGTFRLTFLGRSKDIISEASVKRKKGQKRGKRRSKQSKQYVCPYTQNKYFSILAHAPNYKFAG